MPAEIISSPVVSFTLMDFTRASLVVPSLREQNAPGIIKELSHCLHKEGYVPDLLPFYHAALNQELLGDSGIECGMALPHARLSGVRKLSFAFGRASRAVNWGNRGASAVEFVFLLAVPATDAVQYLHLLSTLARLGQRPDVLAQIRAAADPQEIVRLFAQLQVKHS